MSDILANHFTRGSIGDCIGRDIFCYNASSSDHDVIPDGYARHNDHAAADPYIVPNNDGCALCFTKCKRAILFW